MGADNDLAPGDTGEQALRWVTALLNGDMSTCRRLTHPEFRSIVSGDLKLSGVRDFDGFLAMSARFRKHTKSGAEFAFRIGSVTFDERRACMEVESLIPLRSGAMFNNHYVWIVEFRDSLVWRFKEVMDTLHAHQVVDDEDYRMQRPERVNHMFDEPIATINGVL